MKIKSVALAATLLAVAGAASAGITGSGGGPSLKSDVIDTSVTGTGGAGLKSTVINTSITGSGGAGLTDTGITGTGR